MRTTLLTLAFAAALVAAAPGASTFTFDTPNTVTGDALVTTFTINYATYETEDEFGDPLTVPRWVADITAPGIIVEDPSTMDYGAAISGNALEGVYSPVLFTFADALDLSGFGVTLDNSTYGNLVDTYISFYDSNDVLISSYLVDQTVPGFQLSGLNVAGVSKIVLPVGAYYDNMTFNSTVAAVPEPSVAGLGVLGFAFALFRRRRAGRGVRA